MIYTVNRIEANAENAKSGQHAIKLAERVVIASSDSDVCVEAVQ